MLGFHLHQRFLLYKDPVDMRKGVYGLFGYMWVINSPKLRMNYFDFYPGRDSQIP